jgi:2-keto-4-pentenoate hydratase/2-oxohepta-3-ene-1,7-dioic acid hydratase in catechol pathway
MRICRYLTDAGPRLGLVGQDRVYVASGDMFAPAGLQRGSEVGPLGSVRLLAPLTPGKIVCVGRNYAAHAAELGNEVPAEPLLFMKPPSAVIGPGVDIELLPEMGRVDHEAELAVVIGKTGRFIPPAQALEHVLGYTCANDVSDRDFQKKDVQFTRAKGFDTFCPLGPWIETDLDPGSVAVRSRVNGELRQDGHTSLMLFNVPTLIGHISRVMTLFPGDLILTGTPAGVNPLRPGDAVEIEVEGIGVLTNSVVMRDI